MEKSSRFSAIIFVLFSCLSCSTGHAESSLRLKNPDRFVPATDEVRIALLGDTDSGDNFGAVLALAATEKSDVIMINGDFDYSGSPESWQRRVSASLDTDTIPVIGALGNHDLGGNENKYISIFKNFRTARNGLNSKCTGQSVLTQGQDIAAVDETCTFGNVSIIASAIGQVLNKPYLESRLEDKLKAAPNQNWKLAGYHFTLWNMNPGIKTDENTYRFFDLIRQYGAIGAQAHTHSIMASCPISSVFQKGSLVQCHPEFRGQLEDRFILPGTGIYLDSSLGGKEVRRRGRCHNSNESQCEHMVDLITKEGYTRTDGVKKSNFNPFGALFLVFNSGGDPSKAMAYYKSIDGQIIFSFNIRRSL